MALIMSRFDLRDYVFCMLSGEILYANETHSWRAKAEITCFVYVTEIDRFLRKL